MPGIVLGKSHVSGHSLPANVINIIDEAEVGGKQRNFVLPQQILALEAKIEEIDIQ